MSKKATVRQIPTFSHEERKQALLRVLEKWIRQRPGLEFGNYGNLSTYRAELRSIARDKSDAIELLSAVATKGGITAGDIITAAQSAYSGRLTINEKSAGVFSIDYCTGQYWPTEYRRAVCAVLANALWNYAREQPIEYLAQGAAFTGSRGDALRMYFRRWFGRAIQSRWFD